MKNILAKLHKISGITVDKDKKNPHFGNMYASLDNIVNTISPILKENGLVLAHAMSNVEWVTYLVTSIFDIESGEWLSSSFPIAVQEPQKVGSAITYWKRYNTSCLLNLVSDEDDDWNATKWVAPVKTTTNYWFN